MAVLGGGTVSYARGTPVAQEACPSAQQAFAQVPGQEFPDREGSLENVGMATFGNGSFYRREGRLSSMCDGAQGQFFCPMPLHRPGTL